MILIVDFVIYLASEKSISDLIHLAELCIEVLRQNEEHHAEVGAVSFLPRSRTFFKYIPFLFIYLPYGFINLLILLKKIKLSNDQRINFIKDLFKEKCYNTLKIFIYQDKNEDISQICMWSKHIL